MSGVKADETGLHARDCECNRCEAGYRPTEPERWVAARALRMRLVEAERRKKQEEIEASKVRPRPQSAAQAWSGQQEPWPAKEEINKQLSQMKGPKQ